MTERKKKKTRTMYMHTLDGRPAKYIEGEQIVFGGWRVSNLATSLKQIREEQRRSDKWRQKRGFTEVYEASYVRVEVPND